MARNALTRRAARLALAGEFFVAASTQGVELIFEQRPHLGVGDMAVHAGLATRIINIVVVTIDAADARVIAMCKCHRQDQFRAVVVVSTFRLLTGEG